MYFAICIDKFVVCTTLMSHGIGYGMHAENFSIFMNQALSNLPKSGFANSILISWHGVSITHYCHL